MTAFDEWSSWGFSLWNECYFQSQRIGTTTWLSLMRSYGFWLKQLVWLSQIEGSR